MEQDYQLKDRLENANTAEMQLNFTQVELKWIEDSYRRSERWRQKARRIRHLLFGIGTTLKSPIISYYLFEKS